MVVQDFATIHSRNQLFDPDEKPLFDMFEHNWNKKEEWTSYTQLQGCNKADWCFQSLHTESYSCCFPCFPALTVYYFSDVWLAHQSRNWMELEWRLQQSSLYAVNHPFCIILLGIWKMDTPGIFDAFSIPCGVDRIFDPWHPLAALEGFASITSWAKRRRAKQRSEHWRFASWASACWARRTGQLKRMGRKNEHTIQHSDWDLTWFNMI